jgi:hypothetical protein
MSLESDVSQPDEPAVVEGEPLEIVNEFAEVLVRKVRTRNGARLEIVAPRVGRVIRLCPLELESLTWQTTATFSAFLATPHGPESEE